MTEYRKNKADRCLEKARGISTNTSRVALVWLFVLLSVWFVKIEPHFNNEVRDVSLAISEKQAIGNKISAIRSEKQNKIETHEISKEATFIDKKLKRKREKAVKIVFPIPGLGDLPIPALYAPVFCVLLSFGLLVYLYQSRRNAYRYAALSHLIYYRELGVSNSDLNGYAEGIGWWTRPSPTADGESISASAFSEYIGKRDQEIAALISVTTLMTILIALDVRMGFLLWSTFSALSHAKLEKVLLVSVHVSVFVASLLCVYFWFKRMAVPDYDERMVPRFNASRRELMASGGAIAAALVVFPVFRFVNAKIYKVLWKNPRYVINSVLSSQMTTLKAFTFYLNTKSKVCHYIFSGGLLKLPGRINQSNFSELPVTKILDPNNDYSVNIDQASVSCEDKALKLIKSGEVTTACDLLLRTITWLLETQQSAIRLTDLLAGISVRFNNGYQEKLIYQIRVSGKETLFTQRINKWEDIDSTWRQRWSDKSHLVKWAGLLM